MNPLTVKVMEEVGISLEGQYSKSLREYLGKQLFAYLITVCADAEEKCPSVWPGVQHIVCIGNSTTRLPLKGMKRKSWPSSARCATR